MAIFGAQVTVSGAAYASAPDVDLSGRGGFVPRSWHFAMMSGGASDQVMVSFDGVNDHLPVLAKGTSADSPTVDDAFQKVWLKKAAGTPVVFVTACTGVVR